MLVVSIILEAISRARALECSLYIIIYRYDVMQSVISARANSHAVSFAHFQFPNLNFELQ